MRIAIGADHRGADALRAIVPVLEARGHQVAVMGRCDAGPCDYPDHAYLVGQAVRQDEAERGILICGSAIGMAIAANKILGIRAAVVHDESGAQLSRRHNDANVLCLSGDNTDSKTIERLVDIWLEAPFDGGRHARRVSKIAAIERGENPAETVSDATTA